MNSLTVIDSNIISLFVLAIVFIASITINLNEASKKTYLYYLIFTTVAMIVIQSAIRLISETPESAQGAAVKTLSFIYIALVPVLPAIWALYITNQKIPRILRDKFILVLFFVPAIINMIMLSIGISQQLYTIIFSIMPIVYTMFIVIKFNYSDNKINNFAYIAYVTIAALASVVDIVSLAGASVSILVLFLSTEISASKLDVLTKISSRRHLYSHLERLVRFKKQFTLIMFDMDKLKHINDTYGHIEGDEAIRNVTSIIKSQIRRNDFFARYAGDEFMLVVESCDRYVIKNLLKRIDESFDLHNEKGEKKYLLSISSGYYINDEFNTNIEDMIEKADGNMFKNKRKKLITNWQRNLELISVYK